MTDVLPASDVTVVVITYRGVGLLPACLDSLVAQTQPHRLLVIDNASDDGSASLLAHRLPAEQVVRLDRNAGFAGGVAAALELVDSRFIALLNDDAVAAPTWLETLVAPALSEDYANRRTAAWTAVMVRADRPDTVQNAGAGLLANGYGIDLLVGAAAATATDAEVFGFCGGAALLRADAVRAVGGFPAEFFLYYEDLDTSWRLRAAGWQIRRVAGSRVLHHHSATADQRSALFHRHNERNRLWCLIRNAPTRSAVGGLLRFTVTTGSLALRRLLRQPIPESPNLRIGLRALVLRDVLRALPRLIAERYRLATVTTSTRGTLWRQWAGRVD